MQLVYDPRLVEEVVFNDLRKREMERDDPLVNAYHREADVIYEKSSMKDRGAQFEKLNISYFSKLGFDRIAHDLISQFDTLTKSARAIAFIKTANPHEEGTNVSREGAKVALRMRPELFTDQPSLRCFLNHELMHASDMLAPAFGYRYQKKLGVGNPSQENLVRERYRIIWDIFVDSRLCEKGMETVSDKESRYGEFEAIYHKIPSHVRSVLFERLWGERSLTHERILGMAVDTCSLLKSMQADVDLTDNEELASFLPGEPCPLCGFPAYDRVDLSLGDRRVVRDAIIEENPHWDPAIGACARCVECYEVRTGLW